MLDKLKEATGLDIYPKSVVEATEDLVLFMARKGTDKFVGVWGPGCWEGLEEVAVVDDKCVCVGPCDHTAAEKVREILPWTAPKCIGLGTSAGLGDRLGLATPGHIRAIREKGKGKITPILAQQSIREMTRTERTPQQVMDCATFGVLQEGYRDGFGSDADHLQQPEDIDSTYAAGFTMFTIDPGLHVVNEADEMVHDQLADEYGKLDFDLLDIDPAKLKVLYVGKVFELKGGLTVDFNEDTFLRGMVKYGKAIAHTVKMYRHLESIADRDF
ncbi:MAG: tagaturonate epimerase family protein, partial [Phycisphaerae bacterium]